MGLGWMVIIGHWFSKSTFGANNFRNIYCKVNGLKNWLCDI